MALQPFTRTLIPRSPETSSFNVSPPNYIRLKLIFGSAGANAKKCLRADNVNGAPVQITDCTGGDDQEWKFGPNGAISLYNGAKCLDVTNGANTNGNKLQVWNCAKNYNQEFDYTNYGDNQ